MTLSLDQTQDKDRINKKPKDMTLHELRNETENLKREGIDPAPLITQVHQNLSLAFSCLVFILLGCPLAIITRRREKSINLGIASVVVGAYYILLVTSKSLSLQGYVSPQIAMWAPNIAFGAIGIILTYRLCAY